MKKHLFILLSTVFVTVLSNAQEYTNYKIENGEFYACVDEKGFVDLTYVDLSCHFGCQAGSSSSRLWSSYICVNYTDSDSSSNYYDGKWFTRGSQVRWICKCHSNADNIYTNLEGWKDRKGSPYTYTGVDNFYSMGTDSYTDISGAIPVIQGQIFRGVISGVNYIENGTAVSYGYCMVEFDVRWNWSIPVNLGFSFSHMFSSSLG